MNPSTFNISLSPELARFVREKVKSGLYSSVSEVVREAIRRLAAEDARHGGSVAEPGFDQKSVRAAIEGLRGLSSRQKLGKELTVRKLIDEGRK
jgi:antitoxin ParD1/3/4